MGDGMVALSLACVQEHLISFPAHFRSWELMHLPCRYFGVCSGQDPARVGRQQHHAGGQWQSGLLQPREAVLVHL